MAIWACQDMNYVKVKPMVSGDVMQNVTGRSPWTQLNCEPEDDLKPTHCSMYNK